MESSTVAEVIRLYWARTISSVWPDQDLRSVVPAGER